MSYLQVDDSDFLSDLIRRKEFFMFSKENLEDSKSRLNHIIDEDEEVLPKFLLEPDIERRRYLRLHSSQMFTRNFMNPNTPFKRLLIKWDTGTGKTIAAIATAIKFIEYYQREQVSGSSEIGSVFVIGFTSKTFKKELLRHPELGFISRREKALLDKLRRLSENGSKLDANKLQENLIRFKKRFTNRKGYGFFKFFGYKEFVNRIFDTVDPELNLSKMSDEDVQIAIGKGQIKYNEELMNQFKNSLIICDEIHNVYNSLYQNNWGVAIQHVLDNNPSTRAIFMSATPLNNNPTEIVDLMNLLLPKDKRLSKTELFIAPRGKKITDKSNNLKPGALNKLAKLVSGRISFLRDMNPKYFPKRTFEGKSIKKIPYLKFIRCPMSSEHYKTYKKVFTGTLSQDSRYLNDFVLPNPSNPKVGMYQTAVIKKELRTASQKWKDKMKLDFRNSRIVGDITKKENLKKWSTKNVKMLDEVTKSLKQKKGKMFIFHNTVHMSGVLFVEEVLKNNGFIDEYSSPSDETLCVVCGNPKKMHDLKKGGAFLSDKQYSLTRTELEEADLTKEFDTDDQGFLDSAMENKGLEIEHPEENPAGSDHVHNFENHEEHEKHLQEFHSMKSQDLIKKGGIPVEVVDKGKCYYDKIHCIARSNDTSDFAKKGGKNKIRDHKYIPVRFIMAHSDLESGSLDRSLEKFNSPDNAEGYKYMILVGSKVIKESYDLKAIRNVFILGRPDNIPTLIQIIGRAVRKGSHIDLPPEKRNVIVKIFVSSLPKPKPGPGTYEEIKYYEKMQDYLVIQQIEKIFHKNAVDAAINHDTIFPGNKKQYKKPELGALWFEPNVKLPNITNIKSNKLNLSTFNAYHSKNEVDYIVSLIKRLFIEISPIWKYNDLLYAVRNPPTLSMVGKTEINTNLLGEDNFIIALHRLVWSKKAEYTEPIILVGQHSKDSFDYSNQEIDETYSEMSELIDRMFDPSDKLILLPTPENSGMKKNNGYVITQSGEFYMLAPLSGDEPVIDSELPYRFLESTEPVKLDIKRFLENKAINFDYESKRKKFKIKYENTNFDNLGDAVCDYGSDFHRMFLEETIKYVFNLWTDNIKLNKEFHDFYFKMLYYYDLVGLVIWVNTVKDMIAKKYKEFTHGPISKKGSIEMLKTNLNKSSCSWCPDAAKKNYVSVLEKSKKLLKKKRKKAPSNLLPIGHYMQNNPRFYHPDPKIGSESEGGWYEVPYYADTIKKYKENDIIIGYDEKSKTGVHIRFKIRNPIQNIKRFKDIRMIERGSMCHSKSKTFLLDIAKKLKLDLSNKVRLLNINEICTEIRAKLIYNEIQERSRGTNKKWHYMYWEKRPEIN